ncbi:hypothetical protein GGQ68_000222 [Sagittula marina]|uniref:Uncharacterized protein n=1 Tax=Sagittula marina TaxID=943940 RepID=A0A7W6GQ17_9RHOB|nr:hypothetical protein [Sagittula marina]MBB3983911.1 hypothetical protein [Sagittula marina]
MTVSSRIPVDSAHTCSEEAAVHLAQRLSVANRPDTLREDVAAHCDDAARLGVLYALLMSDCGPEERLYARIARRREAMLALDHAELHFSMQARQASDVLSRQLADAMRHAAKSGRQQLSQEIDDLSHRHAEEAALRDSLSGMTRRSA